MRWVVCRGYEKLKEMKRLTENAGPSFFFLMPLVA
jgi:hypothetical protein